MNAYIYAAELLCEPCAQEIMADLTLAGQAPANPADEHTYDSGDYPKGPFTDGGGEADTPSHCGNCDTFLCNSLTPEGADYARNMIRQRHGAPGVLRQWRAFYDLARA